MQVRRYARQLLDGVAALHDRGVIHRDIKGANIFLTSDNLRLKLGDFGCAIRSVLFYLFFVIDRFELSSY